MLLGLMTLSGLWNKNPIRIEPSNNDTQDEGQLEEKQEHETGETTMNQVF
jgi:hypothetical protein